MTKLFAFMGGAAWDPTQISGLDAYLDARYGVTDAGAGAVSAWLDQGPNSRNFVQAVGANRPTLTASVFGSLPSIRFVPEQWVSLASPVTMVSGSKSYFAVASWTTSTAGNPRPGMSIIGDDNGDYECFGTDADKLAFQSYNSAGSVTHYSVRGSLLNDGVARLVGITADATTDEKIYVGTSQQGATNSPGVVDSTRYKTIGETFGHGAGFNGDIAAIIIVDGVISGSDLSLLNTWSQTVWGTP